MEIEGIGHDNTEALLDEFHKHASVRDFLAADVRLPIHATALWDPLASLDFTFDVDGVVIELETVRSLLGGLHYLRLPLLHRNALTLQYQYLKKHVNLRAYSPDGIAALRNAVGWKIGDVDGGYVLSMAVVPVSRTHPDPRLQTRSVYNGLAVELLNAVTRSFRELLKGLSDKEKSRPTIQKQGSAVTERFRILRGDSMFIMSLLDQALAEASASSSHLKVIVTLGQFGQKDTDRLDLTDLVDPSGVRAVSVHLACTLMHKRKETHLLFSRYGLQDLVGFRGSLYSTLGMHEAVNFQSNLDSNPMDVSDVLLRILGDRGTLTFLQLYVDSPHCHLRTPFKHPVSGALVTCGLSHPNHQQAVLSRALAYMSHMRDLADRMVAQLGCRIEQVLRFEGDVPAAFDPQEHFDLRAACDLLRERALLVLFEDTAGGEGLLATLRGVLDCLNDTLYEAFRSSRGVGRFDPTWKAFQCELALEEIFYGRPLSPTDYALSQSLGTSTVALKSLTHERGFIGLAPHNRGGVEESPPPLCHWTRDVLQSHRILRIWQYCQALEAGPAVLGSSLIRVLLGDLYKRNDNIPMSTFTSPERPPGRVVGAISLETLCKDLATRQTFRAPHTFQRARALASAAGQDVEHCLTRGFLAEGVVFFPAVKFKDPRGGNKTWWSGFDFVNVHPGDSEPSPLAVVATRSLEVMTEIDRRSLVFSAGLAVYREHGMPWMEKVMERLPTGLKGYLLLLVLTFVSAVGILQNGGYVDFEKLKYLICDMSKGGGGMSQAHLQKLQILGRYTLDKVYSVTVWRLHQDIPYKLEQKKVTWPGKLKRPRQEDKVEEFVQPQEDVQAVEEQDDLKPPVRSLAMCLPDNSRKKWTDLELSLVNPDRNLKPKDAYLMYVNGCVARRIEIRTVRAFRAKRLELLNR